MVWSTGVLIYLLFQCQGAKKCNQLGNQRVDGMLSLFIVHATDLYGVSYSETVIHISSIRVTSQ